MGIDDLWKILEPTFQTRSFRQLCIEEGFRANRRNTGAVVIGVDASVWMVQCQAVFWNPRHAQAGQNPELRTLFYKLAHLGASGAVAVFVFDGAKRPSVKRNTKVIKKLHWLTAEFQKMIALFGFYSYTAEGEAEAELAALNRFRLIDLILTSDNDVFVFGATHMIRGCSGRNQDLYLEGDQRQTFSWDQVGRVSFDCATLRGDYDTVGLQKCGIKIALGLIRCGFGDTLLAAAQTLSREALPDFVATWREEIRSELATNSRGYLPGKYRALAGSIPSDFPDINIVFLYVQPVTSWSNGGTAPDSSKWIGRVPELPGLALYCATKFGWTSVEINSKFKKLLFDGIYFRRLLMPYSEIEILKAHVIHGRVNEEHPPLSASDSLAWLGPETMAQAWLHLAQASKIPSQSRSQGSWPGLAWLGSSHGFVTGNPRKAFIRRLEVKNK
ncbi:PIN domain-like protein [Mycena rosella]|uniref:PIN domain-like protein n=1 Tax=Mycena rosella TaxID=1033263 RepID=A0AAD7FFC3_MYCRO|nr:PIN domain-like protein [Mycena rosella]